MSVQHDVYAFDEYVIDPVTRQVLSEHGAVALSDRAFELLLALVDQADRVVDRHALIARVWPARGGSEAGLYGAVCELRRAFGAGVVATVPSRGYKFQPDVAALALR